jgi:hypothetical protein
MTLATTATLEKEKKRREIPLRRRASLALATFRKPTAAFVVDVYSGS